MYDMLGPFFCCFPGPTMAQGPRSGVGASLGHPRTIMATTMGPTMVPTMAKPTMDPTTAPTMETTMAGGSTDARVGATDGRTTATTDRHRLSEVTENTAGPGFLGEISCAHIPQTNINYQKSRWLKGRKFP